MTNFDPGGFLVLLTVIPAVVAGSSRLRSRTSPRDSATERTFVLILGILAAGWIAASLLVSTRMLHILAVALAVLGAYAVTRDVREASYGWVLGVVVLYLAFGILASTGSYGGVDATGRSEGVIASNLFVSYYGGLFVCGATGGTLVRVPGQRRATG